MILDENDNRPTFSPAPTNLTIPENTPVNSELTVLAASDNDEGTNADIFYTIISVLGDASAFQINSSSGVLTLVSSLDFEVRTVHIVTVSATDGGDPALSSSEQIVVYVEDVNDNPPVFLQSSYSFAVAETTSPPLFLGAVSASDADSGVNAVVEYAIVSGNEQNRFSINQTSGSITLVAGVDFEGQTLYSLSVTASNALASPMRVTAVSVFISVTEENEFPPVFSQNTYTASVMENQVQRTTVTTVTVTDNDRGVSGEVTVSIIEGDPQGNFQILNDVVVATTRPLNYEAQEMYMLTLQAVDGVTPGMTATAVVIVSVLDQNDNLPVFTSLLYTGSIFEDAPPGSTVSVTPQLVANDRDSPGNNSLITYSIFSGNDTIFSIHPENAAITTLLPLDREMISMETLVVLAADGGSPSLSSQTTVRITILNVNDNPPHIENVTSPITFTEEQGSISVAPSAVVTDPDLLQLSSLTAEILDGNLNPGTHPDSLSLSLPSGSSTITQSVTLDGRSVRVSGSFSSEEATSILRSLTLSNSESEPSSDIRIVRIAVFDGMHTSTNHVSVNFELINDNRPVLELNSNNRSDAQNYQVTFTEEGPSIPITGQVTITDADRGETMLQRVDITLVDTQDGSAEGIDVQNAPSSLRVEGNRMHTVSIVGGASHADYATALQSTVYFNQADEPGSSPPTRNVTFTAHDAALSSTPVYTSVQLVYLNDPPFVNLGGNINTEVLYVERTGPVNLLSSDRLELTDSDSTELTFAVINLLAAPDGQSESINIDRNGPSSIAVTSDAQSITLTGPASITDFRTLLLTLTYENTSPNPSVTRREVQITVNDGNANSSVASAFVSFSVVNDPPLVDLNGVGLEGVNFETVFQESGAAVGVGSQSAIVSDVDSQAIVSLTAVLETRPDGGVEGLQLSQTVTANVETSYTPSSGTLAVSGVLSLAAYTTVLRNILYYNTADEPIVGVRQIAVVVNDGEVNSSIAYASVSVQPVNDPPVVSITSNGSPFFTSFVEGSSSVEIVDTSSTSIVDQDNSTLDSLSAVITGMNDGVSELVGYADPSSGDLVVSVQTVSSERQYTFSFSSLSSSTVENFASLLSSLTYVNSLSEPTAGQRRISITASDGESSSDAVSAIVQVVLSNDNIPVLVEETVSALVEENTADVVVARVQATDADTNVGPYAGHGEVRYNITSGNEGGYFSIGYVSGELTVVRVVDREGNLGDFPSQLQVTVSNPDPLAQGVGDFPVATVILSVVDVNDNSPQFGSLSYDFTISESATNGNTVGTVNATDVDSAANAQILFAISSGDPFGIFIIGGESGEISVQDASRLDREVQAVHTLSVTANDQGSPPLTSTSTVRITLLDVNDNSPIFESPTYTISVNESATISTVFLTISASDSDEGVNSNVSYTIHRNSSEDSRVPFDVDPLLGQLYVSGSLDFEETQMYSFTVVATDGGTPIPLSSSAAVTVNILNINDNPPLFTSPFYNGSVSEGDQPPVFVLAVEAVDLDGNLNGDPTYTIVTPGVPFDVGSSTGLLTTSLVLDREQVATYEFDIRVEDGGVPPMSSTVRVLVEVLDVNDNVPLFPQTSVTVNISENSSQGSTVLVTSVEDEDSGNNAAVSFSLDAVGQNSGVFSLTREGNSVTLVLSAPLDREVRDMYQVTVVAMDAGIPSQTSSLQVTVTITDVNDNPPVFDPLIYTLSVTEEQPAGLVDTITATDPDIGPNAEILYTIVSEDSNLPFSVDRETGELRTTNVLDREQRTNYSFVILATNDLFTAQASVSITVIDVNDNSPLFDPPTYNVNLDEDASLNSEVVTVSATDPDEGPSGMVLYTLTGGNEEGRFSIHTQTGLVILVMPLDAETRQFYVINITAQDLGTPSLSSVVTVAISIQDVNDEPISLQPQQASVSFTEGAGRVSFASVMFNISDGDIAAAVVSGSITLNATSCGTNQCGERLEVPGFESSVTVSSGGHVLNLIGPLTVENANNLLRSVHYVNSLPEPLAAVRTVVVVVSDGVTSSSSSVTVQISLVNDEPPVVDLFVGDGSGNVNFTTSFTENGPAVPVTGMVSVSDADFSASMLDHIAVRLVGAPDGSSETLSSTHSGNAVQVLTLQGGRELTLNGPASFSDFESALESVVYNNMADSPSLPLQRTVEVVANDGVQASQPAYVSIAITPVNDPPTIRTALSGSHYAVFMEGGDAVATVTTDARITDPDSLQLSSLTVAIGNVIDTGSEVITVETSNFPQGITVSPSPSTSVTFTGPSSVAVFSSLLQRISYQNTAGEPTLGNRTVRFTITDVEGLSSEAVSVVSILPVNDPPSVDLNGPLSGNTYTATFTEGGQAVPVFGSDLEISDPDSSTLTTATITLRNRPDGSSEFLTVGTVPETTLNGRYDRTTGTFTVTGRDTLLAYEVYLKSIMYNNRADEPTADDRLVEVSVSDGVSTSTPAISIVQIQLVNDPPELFLDSPDRLEYSVTFVENGSPVSLANSRGTSVSDADNLLLSHLTVTLVGILDQQLESLDYSTQLPFTVAIAFTSASATYNFTATGAGGNSPASFESLLNSISYSNNASEPNATRTRMVTFAVSDGEVYSQTATATITIQLVDDNQPVFNPSTYVFPVSENAGIGSTVGSLQASDVDNDPFLYILVASSDDFSLSTDGILTTRRNLDRENIDLFVLEAALADPNFPTIPLNSRASVTINVTDVNDNSPMFLPDAYTFTVQEDIGSGVFVGNVTASDDDTGLNAEVEYSIAGSENLPFVIERASGDLRTSASAVLDREVTSTYQFVVMATDRGNPRLSSTASVIVELSDVNDYVPVFVLSVYQVSLLESRGVGADVVQTSASDLDLGRNSQLTYRIQDGNSDSAFSIDGTGLLTVAGTLSHSVRPSYNLTVTAVDGGTPSLTGTTSVFISLVPLSSLSPVFSEPLYTGFALELQPAGIGILTVSASSQITGESDGIMYSLSGSNSSLFIVHPTQGLISTNAMFDRSEGESYNFFVVATNSSDAQLSGTSQVVVNIQDFNDNPPVFVVSQYNFVVFEEVQNGSVVGVVRAEDNGDLGSNAEIVAYTLQTTEPFDISSSGAITVAGRLDYEQRQNTTIIFEVVATDGGNPALSGTATVTVTLQDINDNNPRFSRTRYSASVAENDPIGTYVASVDATDLDAGSNAEIVYSLQSSLQFTIDELTGNITTTRVLDFEQQNDYQLTVFATDRGNPVLSSSAVVTVSITNRDDLPPVFNSSTYTSTIFEGRPAGTFVVGVTAVDPDVVGFNPVQYSILDPSVPFMVNADNGSIYTSAVLDRESVPQYEFTVAASSRTDAGETTSSTASVRVTVADINDNAPVFVGQPFSFMISENASQGVQVTVFTATDGDLPPASSLGDFFVIGNSQPLALDPVSGALTLEGTLDREVQEMYNFTVGVSDMGSPPLSGFASVEVIVLDINDNSPMFEQEVYPVILPENTPTGTHLTTVSATDFDTGLNGEIEYNLVDINNFIRIDNSTGAVTVRNPVDFETSLSFNVSVVAVDKGNPSQTGSSLITVVIQDVDDHPVMFTLTSYSFTLFEDVSMDTRVGMVIAEDTDQFQSNLITYALMPSTDPFPFRIDIQSGDIFTSMLLDRESVASYTFTVTASNTPDHTASATVSVNVMDVNDVVPRFDDLPYAFEVSEAMDPVRLLGAVVARDDDEGENGRVVEYRLEPVDSVLDVVPTTGTIRLVGGLDREITDFYNFTIFAVDGGVSPLTGSASLTLTVNDVNDNRPIFTRNNVTVTLADGDPSGTPVASLPATDADIGENANVTYSIVSSRSLPFAVDQFGDVVTSGNLSPAQIVPYSFAVVATDAGTPAMSSSATVFVYVTDVNQRPSFAQSVYFLTIEEHSAGGTELTQIEALDPEGQVITYSLAPLGSAFSVDSTNGRITVAGILDRETTEGYNLTLTATDSGVPVLSSSVQLVVTVLDINDNSPSFSEPIYTMDVSEGAAVGETVLVVSASDRDAGNNAVVLYSIISDSSGGLFSLNATSGHLVVEEQLDFESSPIYQLRVQAQDGGQPPRVDTVAVFLIVSDVNDIVPTFNQDSYSASLLESSPPNSLVTTVSASDEEFGENGVVRYRIGANDSSMFAVGMMSGEVTTLGPLDRETTPRYDIAVEAFNPNLPSVASTVTVTLTVLDINDEVPVFDQNAYMFRVSENSALGFVVGNVTAVDRDEGTNSDVRYSLNMSSSFFDVDPFTGEISVGGSIDRETNERFEFIIVARDQGSPDMMMSFVSVTIFVNDVNDNQPILTVVDRSFTFFEGSGPILIGSGVSVSDNDSFPINSVTVNVLLDSTQMPNDGDVLSVDTSGIAGLIVDQSSGSHQLAIEGPSSPLRFTQALQTLSFSNVENEPVQGGRTVRITAYDGDFSSNTEEIRVLLLLVNDNPPSLDLSLSVVGLDFTTTFEEGSTSAIMLVGDDLQLVDVDQDSSVHFVNITLTNALDGDSERIYVVLPNDSSVRMSHTSTLHQLTLSGPVGHREMADALRGLRYINTAEEPSSQRREFVFVVSDGMLQSMPARSLVTITIVNDPPILLLGNGTVDTTVLYIESSPHVVLTHPLFQLFDVDSDSLSSASISIVNPQIGTESLNITVPAATTIDVSRTATGITLSGVAPVQEYREILAAVVYANTRAMEGNFEALEAAGTSRRVAFHVTDQDGDAADASSYVTFQGVNNAPIVDANGAQSGSNHAVVFVENEGGAELFALLTVTDVDSANMSNATASIDPVLDVGNEFLSLRVGVSTSLTVVSDSRTGTLTISGSAPISEYVRVLRNILYNNMAAEPDFTARVVMLTISDGISVSSPVYVTVSFQQQNDAPIITAVPQTVVFTEGEINVSLFNQTARLFDPEGDSIVNLRVVLSDDLDAGLETIGYDNTIPSLNALGGNTFRMFTFSPPNNNSDFFTELVRSLTYSNTADEPNNTRSRTVTVITSDGVDERIYSIEITIELVNDNPPVLSDFMFNTSIPENTAVGTVIYTATATDLDVDSVLTFSISNVEGFAVNETTGQLVLSQPLDRESNDFFIFNLFVSDGSETDTLTVTINVLDINDNAPVFSQRVYRSSLLENEPSGMLVVHVSALDADQPNSANSFVTYHLLNEADAFRIAGTSGEIFTRTSLNFEERSFYNLTVLARDGSTTAQMTGTAYVEVTVINGNDFPPQFVNPPSEISFPECEVSQSLLTLAATDADEAGTVNAEISFRFCPDQPSYREFGLLPSNSSDAVKLAVLEALDRENRTSYQLCVEAYNARSVAGCTNSGTGQSSRIMLTVNVGDKNDNAPQFTNAMCNATLSEIEQVSNRTVVTISAFDVDEPGTSNSALKWIAPIEDNPFHINAGNGIITLRRALDYESAPQYQLDYEVADAGPTTPAQPGVFCKDQAATSTITCTFTILDENDNAPTFDGTPYRVEVCEEDSSVGDFFTVSYTDGDRDPYKASSFSIVSWTPDGDVPDLFTINPATGEVSLNRALDREANPVYTINLEVGNREPGVCPDGQTKSCDLISNGTLTIALKDVNDNPPVFSSDQLTAEVPSAVNPPYNIKAIRASDDDIGVNAQISYALQEPPLVPTGTFSINSQTGEVILDGSVQEFEGMSFYLTVIATDRSDGGCGIRPPNMVAVNISVTVVGDLQKICLVFMCNRTVVVNYQSTIERKIEELSNFTVTGPTFVANNIGTENCFSAQNPFTNLLVSFDDLEDQLFNSFTELVNIVPSCPLVSIKSPGREADPVVIPLITPLIPLFALCGAVSLGAIIVLILASNQRRATRRQRKKEYLGNIFFGTAPTDLESRGLIQMEQLQQGTDEITHENPVFIEPFQRWQHVDDSREPSTHVGESAVTVTRGNPAYESQEIRMEMFQDGDDELAVDDDELLAEALKDDSDDEEDILVTAI
jgi:hypothetical protein